MQSDAHGTRENHGDCKLKDINQIDIERTLPPEERIHKFILDIGNPYHFLCGDVDVEIEFRDKESPTLMHIVTQYLISKKAHI